MLRDEPELIPDEPADLQALSVSASQVLKDLAHLEGEHPGRVDCDRDPGFRVAPTSRVLVLDGERAEARYFDTFTSPQAAFDNLKYCLYHVAGLLSA